MAIETKDQWKNRMRSIAFTGYRITRGDTPISRDAEKRKDKELATYKQAREEGSQPMSTRTGEEALRESDRLGRPFRGDNLPETYHPGLTAELGLKTVPNRKFIESTRPAEVVTDAQQ